MKAAQELAFDRMAAETGRALWPGKIRLGGATYDVCLTRNPVQLRFVDGDGSGMREVAGCQVELSKCDHPDEPEQGTIFADEGDNNRLYKIQRLGGRGDTDSVWYLEGVVEE
jgi:hypothetical protein